MRAETSKASEPVVSVRKLPSVRERSAERGRWEVSYGNEATGWRVIGWIEEHSLGRARSRFYFAVGIHPVTASAIGWKVTPASTTA